MKIRRDDPPLMFIDRVILYAVSGYQYFLNVLSRNLLFYVIN